MESGVLWREETQKLHDAEYQDVKLSHMYADNCAMQLVRAPKQFDVIVTDNLFGDILSDVAAMLTGSLGMLPSASLGEVDAKTKKRRALYEPVHGSAPDIAGKGLANPIAMIGSFGMMLRYSFGMTKEADMIEKAIAGALAKGLRTADIKGKSEKTVGTRAMADAILAELGKLAA
jgi:3-isopropylmalate dehydrogenase